MPLYRSVGGEPLCLTCTYYADNTCTFPKRPDAMDCTLYDDVRKPPTDIHSSYKSTFRVKAWVERHIGLLALLGLILISLLLVLMR
jgi:hypothetical protein